MAIRLWFFVHLSFQHFSTGTWVQDFFIIKISYLECMSPLACFISILDHIDIFQKCSIRLATSVVLKIEQNLLTRIPTFFRLKSPPVMSRCASIVFYLSFLTLEHKLFCSQIVCRTRIEFVFRKRVKVFIRTEAVSFIQGS